MDCTLNKKRLSSTEPKKGHTDLISVKRMGGQRKMKMPISMRNMKNMKTDEEKRMKRNNCA
jgi:hypothetical protein